MSEKSSTFSLLRQKGVLLSTSLLLLFAAEPAKSAPADSCPVGQKGAVGTISAAAGARAREAATTDSAVRFEVANNQRVTVLSQEQGQPVTLAGRTSETWDLILTLGCERGFVSSLLVATDIPETELSSPTELTYAGGIFEKLGVKISQIDLEIYSPQPRQLRLTGDKLAKFVQLAGRTPHWDGYGDPTPFDRFSYPNGGINFAKGYLYTDQGEREVWFWRQSAEDPELLTFVWHSFAESTDAQGNHNGSHQFEWYAVPVDAFWAAVS